MIQLNPIGLVRHAIREAHRGACRETVDSQILVDAGWSSALDGLAFSSHTWVVIYLHQMRALFTLHIRSMTDTRAPFGIGASRSPERPNGTGLCAVELIRVGGGVLRVRKLDVLDGTPVLDIKPSVPGRVALENTRFGAWSRQTNA